MTDSEWSQKVKERYGSYCHWPVCFHIDPLIESAHIIPRWDKDHRHNIQNGIPLCSDHHRTFDELTSTAREKMVRLMGRKYP